MSELVVRIWHDVSDAKAGFAKLREAYSTAIETGIRLAARQLLRDTRPYIPVLTGRLRDSGHIEQLEDYAFKLVWDAANPRNGYVYAAKQYDEVLQHVDGRYAAEWVEKVLRANKGRYTYLASRYIAIELQKLFGDRANVRLAGRR